MSFDSALPTTRDRIRFIVGDTSNEPDEEIFPDTTYDATIATHSKWKLAAAEMAEAVAVRIEQDPTSFTAVGDMSVGWSDRTRQLRATAARLRREAADEDMSSGNSIVSVPLIREGASSKGEYAPTRYARLRR